MSIKYNVGTKPDSVEKERHVIKAEVSCGADGHQMEVYFQPGAISSLMDKYNTASEEALIIGLRKSKFTLVIEH